MKADGEKKNTSVTLRIPSQMYKKLKKIAEAEDLSLNVISNHALANFLEWDITAEKVGLVMFHKNTIKEIIQNMDEETLKKIAHQTADNLLDFTLFISGRTDIESCLGMLRKWAKKSGFITTEYEQDTKRRIIFQHDMGRNWSVFYKNHYDKMLHTIGYTPKFEMTDNTLVLEIDKH